MCEKKKMQTLSHTQVMPKGAEPGSQAVATGVTSADGAYSIGPLQVHENIDKAKEFCVAFFFGAFFAGTCLCPHRMAYRTGVPRSGSDERFFLS
jgi:hypothetical protein